ncbi:MAG: OmpA family protein [Candidatus Dactylopiibacterium sp.]|nr:OmpA family protein [Candidatus Dactylopiibacterium sp.]
MHTQHISSRVLAASIIALGALAGGHAQAQSGAGFNPSWYIAPGGHYFDPDDSFNQPENGGGAQLRLGKPLSESWDLQLGTTYSRAWDGAGSYRQNTLGVDALYFFSRSKLRPFVLVGGGAQYDRAVRDGVRESGTSPYVNVGAGVQYFFTEQLGLQADYRYAHAYVEPRDYGFSRANTRLASLGIVYVFDKPAAAPTPVAAVEPPPPAPVAPPPAPAPQPAPAPRTERITLSATELFDFDSARLRGAQPRLDEIANALRSDTQGGQIDITGYTDRLGAEAYNLRLSQQRADAVKGYLVAQGVPASRLNAVGRGEANPVVTCNDRNRAALIKCLEPNRRVEVEEIVITRTAP